MSDAQAGADPSIHPIFGVQAKTPGLNWAFKQVAKTPERVELGQQIGQLAKLGKGFNDSPVGGLAGASGGSAMWSGPAQEGGWDGGAGPAGPSGSPSPAGGGGLDGAGGAAADLGGLGEIAAL